MSQATLDAIQKPIRGRDRRGQHRDHALASWRRCQAVELKMAGRTYQQIADELGYANKGTVHRLISNALAVREVEDVELLREVEVRRLDTLQAALWAQALAGNVAACRAVMEIIVARCRLLGLLEGPGAKHPKDQWDCCQGPRMLVTRPDDCRWKGCEQHGKFPNP